MRKRGIISVVLLLLYVIVFTFAGTCEAKAATLTKAEKKQFTKYLKSKKQGFPYGASTFFVHDINGDGHKDVIASGQSGAHSFSSNIYMHVDGKYKVIPIRGTLSGVSSKGLNVIENDFTGGGATRYYSRIAYKIDKHGNITAENSYNTVKILYDREKNREYSPAKTISKKYLN
ncbi:MAG: hypothetical protein IJ733_03300, partial [Lachnospiraceae bacterium]|nr:hypothetical protein [Lachnospiraceae bacterium]